MIILFFQPRWSFHISIGTDLFYFIPQLEKIFHCSRLLAGIAEKRRGVQGGHHPDPIFHDKISMLLRDFNIGLYNFRGGDSAKTHDDFGLNESYLVT